MFHWVHWDIYLGQNNQCHWSYFYNKIIERVLTLLSLLNTCWPGSKLSLWPGSDLYDVLYRFGWLWCFFFKSFGSATSSSRTVPSDQVCFKGRFLPGPTDSELLLELNSLPSPLSAAESVTQSWEFTSYELQTGLRLMHLLQKCIGLA